jgi:LAGLIDADG-like domain
MALLQGLNDADGHCGGANGAIEYCSVNKELAEGVLELALSLGFKAVLNTGRAILNGKDCGEKYRVQYMAYADNPPFRLARQIESYANLASSQCGRFAVLSRLWSLFRLFLCVV